ncbi:MULTISPECIES: class I SAM-dependent methyltransferase [Methylococcus]|uniref:class I SAM-dependent methyltransferase n=1 Tax=Methylococcus TaxID=413 RepID=UPI002103313F|nr:MULTISPECIES: methyltransferase domain-containing protein [Methylococcus]
MVKRNPAPFPDNVRYGDIVKGLPLGDEACSGVYCSHVLEHLALDDFRKALINTRRLLKPGGIFRLVLPDLAFYISQYFANTSPDAALEFMRNTGLGELSRARGVKGFVQELLGNSRHRWMWDYPSLEKELGQVGFEHIRRAEFGDSLDPTFNQVERQERWTNCLGIECRRI